MSASDFPPPEKFQELRIRAIRADHALRCCEGSKDKYQLRQLQMIDAIESFIRDHAMRYAGADLMVGRVVLPGRQISMRAIEDAQMKIGFVELTGGTDSELGTEVATQPFEVFRKIVNSVRTTTRDSCYDCIKERLWRQDKAERGGSGYHRSRKH